MHLARIGAWASLGCGICALLVVSLGAGAVTVLGGLLGVLGLNMDTWRSLNAYPLGAVGAIAVYALGIALGSLAFRYARWAGLGMLLVGIVAIGLGGPVAKGYGVVLLVAGMLCIAGAQRAARQSTS